MSMILFSAKRWIRITRWWKREILIITSLNTEIAKNQDKGNLSQKISTQKQNLSSKWLKWTMALFYNYQIIDDSPKPLK